MYSPSTPYLGFERPFAKPDSKEVLQSYLYAWVFQKKSSGTSVKAGLYSARSIGKGLLELHGGNIISQEDFTFFEIRLKALLEEMFDLSVPFVQNDAKAYEYSAYQVLID